MSKKLPINQMTSKTATMLAIPAAAYNKREIARTLPFSANAILAEFLFSWRINEIAAKIIPNTLSVILTCLDNSILSNKSCRYSLAGSPVGA